MIGICENGIVSFGMECTAAKGCVAFNGQEGNGVESGDEVRDAAYSDAMLHSIRGTPACCRDVLFVVTEGDEGWCGARVVEEVKVGEEIATTCHMMGGATVWDRVRRLH